MKITVDRKAFSGALSEVLAFIDRKAPIETLKYAKVTTKGKRLKIEGNDRQNGIVKYMEIEDSDTDGSFLIPAEDFAKFFSKLDGDTVEISYDDSQVSVRHKKGTAEFPSAPENEYPSFKMKEGEEEKEISVPTEILREFVNKGKNFVSTNPIRPIMTAIYSYLKDGKFGFCASDTHILIAGSVDFPSDDEASFFIMPGIFTALAKVCPQGDMAHIKFNESQVQYRIGNTIIQTLQSKGNYPNFERVIPKDSTIECVVERDDMTKTLQRVCMFSSESSGLVKLDVSRMDMAVSAQNLDYGKQTTETIPHGGCDGEINIGIQGENMQTCLSVFSPGEVSLKMSEASRPILMEQKENPGLRVIIMPMQIV